MRANKEKELRILKRKNLFTLMSRFLEDREVIAPIKGHGGEVIFYPIETIEDVAWDWTYVNTVLPPKRFFLPQTEELFHYKNQNKGYEITPIYNDRVRMIFGIRPCDVNALLFLDKFFGGGPIGRRAPVAEPGILQDRYYATRRANTFIIAFGCHQPGENCFCICCDSGPFLKEGFDLQLTQLGGDEYIVELGSARGLKIFYGHEDLFRSATNAEEKRLTVIKDKATQQFGNTRAYISKAIQKITQNQVPDELWENLSDRCQDCGGCSYVCPTCCCYNVVDVPTNENEGIRTRTWDSCAFAGFTKLAGGDNPRSEKKDRLKRRFFHKLSYHYIEKNGRHGCVGCGRCINTCFANISMPDIADKIRKGITS
ncbi:MAG: 4Fe-4S dicluster domain-containing protein [bacterium]